MKDCLILMYLVGDAQERNELKARARDEAAAQEARKKKVTVTVDLLGRQVCCFNLIHARYH